MTLREQQSRDGRTHLAEAEESEVCGGWHGNSGKNFCCSVDSMKENAEKKQAAGEGSLFVHQELQPCGPGGLLTPLGFVGAGGGAG